VRRETTADEQAQLEQLNQQLTEVRQQIEDAGEDEERAEPLFEQEDTVSARISAIEDTLRVPDPVQRAAAGAIVSIDRSGDWRVETALLRPEDARKFQRAEKASAKAASGVPRLHSAALVRRLTAHRTLALGVTLTRRPDVALLALAHRLAIKTFFDCD